MPRGAVTYSALPYDFVSKYGYASVFVLMALESASLPTPGEVVLPQVGYFARQGGLDLRVVMVVSTVASLIGALSDYFLAKWLGGRLLPACFTSSGCTKTLDRAEAWFERSTQWTVFAARFVPGLRTVISLPAGLFETDFSRFAVTTITGCFARSVILVYAGSLAGSVSTSAFARPERRALGTCRRDVRCLHRVLCLLC